MMFIGAANEPTMFLLLTEQDVNDMRGGRTKYVDKTATKGHKFDKVIVSVHKNRHEIEEVIRASGHGKLLQDMPSPVPDETQAVCKGCQGNFATYLLWRNQCIHCWAESADNYRGLYLGGRPED